MLGSWFLRLSALIMVLGGFDSNGYLFDSLAQLKDLVNLERELGESLKSYVTIQRERFERITKFSELVRSNIDLVKEHGFGYLDNPINAYSIIKRFTNGWTTVESLLEEEDLYTALKAKLDVIKRRFPSSDNTNLMGAISAMLRLQNTYNLTAESFVNGEIPGCKTASRMSAEDCHELGTVAYRSEQYGKAREWLEEAARLAKHGHYDGTVEVSEILEYLAWTQYVVGDVQQALNTSLELIKLVPNNRNVRRNIEHYSKELKHGRSMTQIQVKAKEERINTDTYKISDYAKLCRGEPIKETKHQGKLKCWYHGRKSPRLMLKPAKIEMVNDNPTVYIYRDLVSEKEVERIKEIATPMLKRATVFNLYTGEVEYADYRVSKSAWLESSIDEVIARVNRRASLVTGLDEASAERLQVANYGMGGQYESHVDFGDSGSLLEQDHDGNRMATLLIYLNDVASGGATVFLKAGIHIPPTKGDAVFWFNLKKSGKGDYLTEHAACPVLCGNKWVANKWFKEHGNIFRRRCSRNPKL